LHLQVVIVKLVSTTLSSFNQT